MAQRAACFFTALLRMQGSLVTRKLSVCRSVRLSVLSNVCIVTKRKKDLSRFLYHTKELRVSELGDGKEVRCLGGWSA